jgi:hypothetical protein
VTEASAALFAIAGVGLLPAALVVVALVRAGVQLSNMRRSIRVAASRSNVGSVSNNSGDN